MTLSPKPTSVNCQSAPVDVGIERVGHHHALGRCRGRRVVFEVDPVGQHAVSGDEALRTVAGRACLGVRVMGIGRWAVATAAPTTAAPTSSSATSTTAPTSSAPTGPWPWGRTGRRRRRLGGRARWRLVASIRCHKLALCFSHGFLQVLNIISQIFNSICKNFSLLI